MMNDKVLHESELKFCELLNKKLFSFDLKRPNNFVDIISVTAILSNRTKMVYFDYLAKEISFWNDFDEQFVRKFDAHGVIELYKIFSFEIKRTCFFTFLCQGREAFEVPHKLSDLSDCNILKTLQEIIPYIKDTFDSILFTDFIGSVKKQIRFDAKLSKYIVVS